MNLRHAKILAVLFLSLVLLPIGSEAAPTPEKPLLIELASTSQAIDIDNNYTVTKRLNEILQEKTNGAIQFDYKPGGQLAAGELEAATGIKIGTLEAAFASFGNVAADVPQLGVLDLPFLFKDKAQAYDFYDNSPGAAELKRLLGDAFNGVVIATPTVGFRNVLNNSHPIKKVADFKGLKIRVMDSPLFVRLFSMLGANPLPMNFPDTLIGLQQGTIDGLDNPLTPAYTSGVYKMVKYIDVTNHAFSCTALLLRKDIFESLSPEQQTILLEAGKEANNYQRDSLEENEKEFIAAMEASNAIVGRDADIEEFRNAVLSIYADYREDTGEALFDSIMEYLGIELE